MRIVSNESCECPKCGRQYKIKTELAEQRVRCKCGHVSQMPATPVIVDMAEPEEPPARNRQRPSIARLSALPPSNGSERLGHMAEDRAKRLGIGVGLITLLFVLHVAGGFMIFFVPWLNLPTVLAHVLFSLTTLLFALAFHWGTLSVMWCAAKIQSNGLWKTTRIVALLPFLVLIAGFMAFRLLMLVEGSPFSDWLPTPTYVSYLLLAGGGVAVCKAGVMPTLNDLSPIHRQMGKPAVIALALVLAGVLLHTWILLLTGSVLY